MGLLEFDKLPINTLVGADWKTFKAVTANKTIDKGFRNKYFLTKSVCRLLSLLQPFEDARYRKIADKPLEMDPVFILDIGVAGRLSCTMSSRVTSISATIRPIRPYFRT